MDVRGRSAERGAGTLEYLAAVLVAAILAAGLLATQQGPQIAAAMDRAICSVTSMAPGGSGSCDTRGNREDFGAPNFEPDECTVSTAGSSEKVDVSIAIIDGGGSHGVQVAEIRHADGRVEYAVSQTGEGNVGVGVGIGGKGKGGEDSPGAELSGDLSVSGSYSGGPTYTVDSLEQAQQIQQQLMGNPFADVGIEPTSETTTWGGSAEGSIDLGIALGDDGNGGHGQTQPGQDVDQAGLNGALDGSHQYSTTVNADGTTVYTTTWTGEITGEGNAMGAAGAAGTWSGSTSIQITRDADGQITHITFETVTEGGSSLTIGGDEIGATGALNQDTVTTHSLAVTGQNRDTVEQWLGSQAAGDSYMGLAPFSSMLWDGTQQASDPMQNLLYQEAQITQLSMDKWEESSTIGGEIKWGVKLGASYTYTDAERNVVDAQYAGAPTGGQRPWHNMEVCFP